MSDTPSQRCGLSAAGHNLHPIQFNLANAASDPVPVTIVGLHDKGIVVARMGDPTQLETWCMHERWRVCIQDALDAGLTTLLSYEYVLAKFGNQYISHATPEMWRECPAPEDLKPWEMGYIEFTRDPM